MRCFTNKASAVTIHFFFLISLLMNSAFANSPDSIYKVMTPPVLVTGKVLNSEGRPIAGVSVQVAGTERGTTTKADGSFELQVEDASGSLLISSVGYEDQEIKLGSTTYFTIRLAQTSTQLNDVVVIGYGTRKKSDLTGAVATVSAENLKDRAVVNFAEAMAGQLAGVQVQQINGATGGE